MEKARREEYGTNECATHNEIWDATWKFEHLSKTVLWYQDKK